MEALEKAVAKVEPWVLARDSFSKQECWQAKKGGIIKSAADLDVILTVLAGRGVIEQVPSERSVRFTVCRSDGEPELQASEARPARKPQLMVIDGAMSDADVLTLASRHRTLDGRCEHLLERIENRHDHKRIGDTFRADELNEHDRHDLDDLRSYLGVS